MQKDITRRLLVVTQTVDEDDLYLGFFHSWLQALAPEFESIEIICLNKGKHTLPANVRVHSLGKETKKASRVVYALRFLSLAWRLRGRYGRVFVHMNQEYLLIAGVLWKILQKPAFLWRNHYAGSWVTDLAVLFCRNVFYTSKHSYTAKYKHALQMPVGVDTKRFSRADASHTSERSILFFARLAPSKRPHVLIEALRILSERGCTYKASIYGSALPEHAAYVSSLHAQAAGLPILFHEGVPNNAAPAVFKAHQIFVNLAPSGMLDKMIFEAAASGCIPLAASQDWAGMVMDERLCFEEDNGEDLADKLEIVLSHPLPEELHARFAGIVEKESLPTLIKKLVPILYA